MFDKIENPTTGRFVNTNSKLGKTIINQLNSFRLDFFYNDQIYFP